MLRTIQDLDKKMYNYLMSIDPIMQTWWSIYHNKYVLPDIVALLENTICVNDIALHIYNIIIGIDNYNCNENIISYFTMHHKQLYQPFLDHYHYYNSQYPDKYTSYYYNLMVCYDKVLLNKSMDMSGVSAGNSLIWIVNKSRIVPTFITKGCIDKINDNEIWLGIDSIEYTIIKPIELIDVVEKCMKLFYRIIFSGL